MEPALRQGGGLLKRELPLSPPPEPESPADLDARIVAALERLAQALHKALWDAAWQRDMSATQAQVLLYVLSQGREGVTLTDLTRRFDLKHSTLSDAVGALTRKGFLDRHPDPNDARAVRLRLSAKGRATARSLQTWAEQIRNQVADLAPNRKGLFLETLLDLIARLQRSGVITVARMCTTCLYFDPNRHPETPDAPHHCRLMNKPLRLVELRVECPDHQPQQIV